jgi:hypothetical protein
MATPTPIRPNLEPSPPAATLSRLLAELRRIGLQRLPALGKAVLNQADDALFDFAQRTGSSLEQQPYFDAMRELRRERAALEQGFESQLDSRFGPLEVEADSGDGGQPLGLVDIELLEEQLACEQVVGACDRRHRELLQRIGSRLQHAVPGLQLPEHGPRWAAQIAAAFRAALAPLAMPIKARLVLLKLFERQLLPHYGELLQVFDRHLQAAGLDPQRPRLPPRARPAEPCVEPRQAWPEHADVGSGTVVTHDAWSNHADSGHAPARFGAAAVRRHDSDVDIEYAGGFARHHRSVEVDDEVFLALRDALALRAARDAGPAHERIPALPRQAALDALTLLQNEPPASILAALDDPRIALAEILASELIAQARSLGLATGHAILQEQDAQALSLVGMLFDVLLAQRSYHRDVRRQFLRLSVPYARAALLDPRLFALKSHPARRLLDALAEASDGNRGETAPERDLLARVDGTVDRLIAEFNEDITIFAELEAEFREFIDQHRLRIQLAEQRAAEAHRGRERLDNARTSAAAELAALVGARTLPDDIVGSFLRDSWTHHLTMVALRDGSDSERYRDAQRLGAAVWGLCLGSGGGAEPLRPALLEVLASSGLHGQLAEASADALCARLADADGAAATAAPIMFRRPDAESERAPTTDIGSDSSTVAGREDVICEAPQPATEPTEEPAWEGLDDAAEQVRALAVGDWVEFVEADGSTVPAKLSWVSPISERRLFVNRRGMRHCAATIDELATMLADDRLLLRGADSAFSRAMRQVLGQLQLPESRRSC